MATVTMQSFETFGDARSKDSYGRHLYRAMKPAASTVAAVVENTSFAIAAPSSTHTEGTQIELSKLRSIENAADGATASVDTTVASLSSVLAKFQSTTVTDDFGTGYTSSLTKGVGRDGTTPATVHTFGTGTSNTAVSLAATSDSIYAKAASLLTSGVVNVGGDAINWTQANGANFKVSSAGSQYLYTHNAGTAGTSTGVSKWSLDPQNVLGNQMASGAFSFNSFNAAGASEEVMNISAGAAAGTQKVTFTNADLGIGGAAVTGTKLTVTGSSNTTGNAQVGGDLAVLGNLNVTGTVTTVNSTSINVGDKLIELANAATTSAAFNGGGVLLGAPGAAQVSFTYDDVLKAWSSSINENLVSGKTYYVAGGTNTTAATGLSLAETGLSFGAGTASLAFGTALTMNKDLLAFTSPSAAISFGSGANLTRIDSNGISTGSDNAAVYFGSLRQWRIQIETINLVKYLSFSYVDDGTVLTPAYVDKFTISP
jgi:hypothetical protein